MAVALLPDLRNRVILALLKASDPARIYFPDVWQFAKVSSVPLDYMNELLDKAASLQGASEDSGPLVTLAAALQVRGQPEGAEIRAAIVAAGGPVVGVDPFLRTSVGWQRRLLLDHETFRSHLRETCTGDRPGVWLSPPLGRASESCIDLIRAVGVALSVRVAGCEWQPGAGLTAASMAETILLYLDGSATPTNTTTLGHVHALAGDIVRAATKATPSDVILVFQNFRVNESPPECLLLIERLIALVCGGTFAKRVRVALVGCELDISLLPRTASGPINLPRLQNEANSHLVDMGLSAEDAAELLADLWPTAPDLEVVHQRVSEILGGL